MQRSARCSGLRRRVPEHQRALVSLANAGTSVSQSAYCVVSALRLRSRAAAPEATPNHRIGSTAVSQPHDGASRQRAAPRSQAMAHRASGRRATELRRHSRGTFPGARLGYAAAVAQRFAMPAPQRMAAMPGSNPSLHLTGYSGLRPPPPAGELQR